MQSTLKIHIKKTNKQNELRIILCLLGSNSSSTTFSLSTDHHDSWRLGHRHLLPENPFSPNTKNQNKASKTNLRFSKAHTRTHLIACMQVSFWLQLLVFQDSEHRFLYKLSLDYNQSHDRRPKSLFRFPDNPPQESSPQLTHPSKTEPAEIREFNSRSCLGSNGWEQQLTWAHISLASRKGSRDTFTKQDMKYWKYFTVTFSKAWEC